MEPSLDNIFGASTSAPVSSSAPIKTSSPSLDNIFGPTAPTTKAPVVKATSLVANTKVPNTSTMFPKSSAIPNVKQAIPDNSTLGIIKNTITGLPKAAWNFLGPGQIQDFLDTPDGQEAAKNLNGMNVLGAIPKTIANVVAAPIADVAGIFTGPKTYNVPGVGEVKNIEQQVKEDVQSGTNPFIAVIKAVPQSIFDGLMVAGFAEKVFSPRESVIATGVKTNDLPSASEIPAQKSFRLSPTPEVKSNPVPNEALTKLQEQGVTLKNFDPKNPTYFRTTPKGNGVIKGEIVQIKPSYFDIFKNTLKENINKVPEEKINVNYEKTTTTQKMLENIQPKPTASVEDIHPTVLQETAQHLETHGPDLTHQALQEKLGVSPEQAGHLVDIAQKQKIAENLKNPEKLAQDTLAKVVPPEATAITEPHTLEDIFKESNKIVTDKAEVQKINNSIAEGKSILQSGKDSLGKPLSDGAKESIQRSITNAQEKIGQKSVPIEKISTGLTPQIESKINVTSDKIQKMVSDLKAGKELPPVPVHVKADGTYELNKDGAHRLTAYRQAGIKNVPIQIQEKTKLTSTAKQTKEREDVEKKKETEKLAQEKHEKKIADEIRKEALSNSPARVLNRHFGRSSDSISQQLENAKGTPRSTFIEDKVSELGYKNIDEAQKDLDSYKKNMQGGFIDPGAMAKSTIEALDKLNSIVEQSQKIEEINGKLSDAIYREEGAAKALKQRLMQFILDHTKDITPLEAEHVYHRLEDPKYPLTPKEEEQILPIGEELDKTLETLRVEYRDLGGVITQDIQGEQTPRYAKEKGGVIDKLLDSVKKKEYPSVKQGGILTKSLGQGAKHRVFHIATDSKGVRHVVSIKGGEVTGFENKKMTNLGSTEAVINPRVKEFYDKNVTPVLEKLAKDLGVVHETAPIKGNKAGLSYTGQKRIKTHPGAPERVLLHEIGHQLDEKYNLQDFFKKDDDRNYGKDTSQKELRAVADLRTEGSVPSPSFKSYVRSGEEKMAAMFEAYLHVPDKFKAVAPNVFEKFEEFLGKHVELKPLLDLEPSIALGMKKFGGELKSGMKGKTFVDNTGNSYEIGQATTREIEQHSNTEYHKDFLVNYSLAIEKTTRAVRALKFINKVKESPDFKDIIAKEGEDDIPAGWKTTKLLQFRGYWFEPKTAEIFDDLAQRQGGRDPLPVYDEINNLLISAIVINPIMHFPNVGMGWASSEAGTGVIPGLSSQSRANFARAVNAVRNKNEDYLTFLEHGASLMDLKGTNKAFADELLKRLSNEVEKTPDQFQKVAKILGYANPLKWMEGLSHFSEKATWTGNDVMLLHALYDHMSRTGSTMEQAITEVSKKLADYRIPSRLGPGKAGRALSKLAQNNALFMFSRYHYSGVIKPWIDNIKDSANPNSTPKERMAGLRTLAFFAIMGLLVKPAIDKMLQKLTGESTSYWSMPGAMRFPQNVAKLAKGDSTLGQFLTSMFSLNPAAKITAGIATGYDPNFGTPVYGPGGEGVTGLATSEITPYVEARKIASGSGTWEDFFLSMGGVYSPKSTSAEKTRNAMVFQEKPQVVKSIKDHILAGDTAGATELARQFNIKLKATIKQSLIENGKSGSDAQVNFVWQKDAIKMPGEAAMKNYSSTQGKSFVDKVFADGKPKVKTDMPIENDSIIHAVQVYAKAITVDPVTAFSDIFHGQTIRMVDNSTVIVYRMSLKDSQAVKTAGGGNNPSMKLDHTLPLQLGGTNEETNLKLVPTATWASYTPVEDYLGTALKNGKVDKATAQKMILDFKSGILNFNDIKKQIN